MSIKVPFFTKKLVTRACLQQRGDCTRFFAPDLPEGFQPPGIGRSRDENDH